MDTFSHLGTGVGSNILTRRMSPRLAGDIEAAIYRRKGKMPNLPWVDCVVFENLSKYGLKAVSQNDWPVGYPTNGP